MIGAVFNNLTVIRMLPNKVTDTGRSINISKMALCKCICGKELPIRLNHLISGNTKSCGCFKKQATGDRARKHGLSRTSEYMVWCKMKARCYNNKTRDYKWYGAKGIRVCNRWLVSFENFIDDMGKRPSNKHSIERIKSYKNYTPSNCYWGTPKEQARNQGRTIRVRYNGETLPLITLCERLNKSTTLVRSRIRAGWFLKDALLLPTQRKKLNQ